MKTINVQTKLESELKKLKKKIPQEGNIRLLKITEKQYSEMIILLGNQNIEELYNGPERFIKI